MEKFNNRKYTDDFQIKHKSTFFPMKDSNSELNTFFKKNSVIVNLKEKNYTRKPLTNR